MHSANLAAQAGLCGIFWTRTPLEVGLLPRIKEGIQVQKNTTPGTPEPNKTIACGVERPGDRGSNWGRAQNQLLDGAAAPTAVPESEAKWLAA